MLAAGFRSVTFASVNHLGTNGVDQHSWHGCQGLSVTPDHVLFQDNLHIQASLNKSRKNISITNKTKFKVILPKNKLCQQLNYKTLQKDKS